MTKSLNRLQTNQKTSSDSKAQLPTFLDHVRELRRRLLWVVGFVLLASSIAFPLQQQVIQVLTLPLGSQSLYYLTPIGGLSFIIKISIYAGIILAIPVIIYHLYRYLEPLMGQKRKKSVVFYIGMSSLLAFGGILFAYLVSLPAALHFLTGLNISNVQAMLTVDAYLSFVMTYLLASAALFQIPLVLLIVNGITPLPPGKLMKAQRWVIVGSFILSAMISPTPDIINQALLAGPIIVMYQIGVTIIWLKQRQPKTNSAPKTVGNGLASFDLPKDLLEPANFETPAPEVVKTRSKAPAVKPQASPKPAPINDFRIAGVKSTTSTSRTSPRPALSRQIRVPARSVDGIVRSTLPSAT